MLTVVSSEVKFLGGITDSYQAGVFHVINAWYADEKAGRGLYIWNKNPNDVHFVILDAEIRQAYVGGLVESNVTFWKLFRWKRL